MASLTQPGMDRMLWLPAPGYPTTHWGLDLYVYLLLVPLYLYDAITLRRIHPATLWGTAVLLLGHVASNLAWGNPAWHRIVAALDMASDSPAASRGVLSGQEHAPSSRLVQIEADQVIPIAQERSWRILERAWAVEQ